MNQQQKLKPTCPGCEADSPDWMLCKRCMRELKDYLLELPDLMRQLRLTFSRQTQIGTGNGGKGAETSVPYVEGITEMVNTTGSMVSTWMRELDLGDLLVRVEKCVCVSPLEPCAMEVSMVPRRPTMTTWCAWLLERIQRIRGHAAAGELLKDFTEADRAIRRKIDLPADRVFCGLCPTCNESMFAVRGKAGVVCRKCAGVARVANREAEEGAAPIEPPVYDVEDQRDRLRKQLQSRLATQREILTAIPSIYGAPINSGTFRSWVSRGQIAQRGHRDGVAVYSVDEALNLAAEAAARAADLAGARGKRKEKVA